MPPVCSAPRTIVATSIERWLAASALASRLSMMAVSFLVERPVAGDDRVGRDERAGLASEDLPDALNDRADRDDRADADGQAEKEEQEAPP